MVTWTGAVQKTQEMAQSSTGKGLDAAAVLTGFAVWADRIPTIVGVFTIVWLGMQMIINFPKLIESVKKIKGWFKSRKGE